MIKKGAYGHDPFDTGHSKMDMRLGCCVNMHATRESRIGEEWLPLLREVGFDYVELPLAEVMALDSDAFEALRAKIREAGIPCEAMNNFFPPTFRLTGPSPDNDQAILTYVKNAFARARLLGAEMIVFGSGAAKRYPEGFSEQKAKRQLLSLAKKIDLLAKSYHLSVALEPLNRGECNLINSFEEGCQLVSLASASHTRVLIDTYHMALEQEPPSVMEKHPGQLAHVHISSPFTADGKERRFPLPGDGWDAASFGGALVRAGYSGRVSIEAFSDDLAVEAGPALQYLRHFF